MILTMTPSSAAGQFPASSLTRSTSSNSLRRRSTDSSTTTSMSPSASVRKSPLQSVYKHIGEGSPNFLSLSRRVSEIFRSSSSASKDVKFSLDTATDDIKRLEDILSDRMARSDLVDAVLAAHSAETVIKIRFISVFQEWLQCTEKKERLMKAKKIVEVFFTPKSNYFLKSVPLGIIHDLQAARYDSFLAAQAHALTELLRDPTVNNFISSLA